MSGLAMRTLASAVLGLVCLVIELPCCLAVADEDLAEGCEESVVDDSSCMLQKTYVSGAAGSPARLGEAEKAASLVLQHADDSQRRQECETTGARGWMSRAGLDDVARYVVAPIIVGRLAGRGLVPKTVELTGFKAVLSNFNFMKITLEPPVLSIKEGVGLEFFLHGLSVDLDVDYMVEGTDWWNPLWSSGTAHARLVEKSTMLGMGYVDITDDGYPEIRLDLQDISLRIDDLRISGSVFAGLVNLLQDLFVGTVEEMVAKRIESGVESFVAEDLNAMLRDGVPLRMPLSFPAPYNTTELDFSLCGIAFGKDYISADIKGLVSDLAEPEAQFPNLPRRVDEVCKDKPSWTDADGNTCEAYADYGWCADGGSGPNWDTTWGIFETFPAADACCVCGNGKGPPSDLQKYDVAGSLGQWVLNGFFWHLQRQDLLKVKIYDSMLPSNSSFRLRTDALNMLFPQYWSWNFWQGRTYPMDLVLSTASAPTINFTNGTLMLNAIVDMTFEIVGAPTDNTVALAVQVPFKASIGLDIVGHKPQRLDVNLHSFSVTPVKLISSIVKLQSPTGLNWMIWMIMSTVVTPMINKGIAGGLNLTEIGPITPIQTGLRLSTSLITGLADVDLNITSFITELYGSKAEAAALEALHKFR